MPLHSLAYATRRIAQSSVALLRHTIRYILAAILVASLWYSGTSLTSYTSVSVFLSLMVFILYIVHELQAVARLTRDERSRFDVLSARHERILTSYMTKRLSDGAGYSKIGPTFFLDAREVSDFDLAHSIKRLTSRAKDELTRENSSYGAIFLQNFSRKIGENNVVNPVALYKNMSRLAQSIIDQSESPSLAQLCLDNTRIMINISDVVSLESAMSTGVLLYSDEELFEDMEDKFDKRGIENAFKKVNMEAWRRKNPVEDPNEVAASLAKSFERYKTKSGRNPR